MEREPPMVTQMAVAEQIDMNRRDGFFTKHLALRCRMMQGWIRIEFCA